MVQIARKWNLNLIYDGDISHRCQLPIQVMGAYARRDPSRLKKVDTSYRDQIVDGASKQMISEMPPTKKRKSNTQNGVTLLQSNDSLSDLTKDLQHDRREELINQLTLLHINEWKGLPEDILQYEVDKMRRLQPLQLLAPQGI